MSAKFTFWDKTIRLAIGAIIIYSCGFIYGSYWWLFGAWLVITAVYGCPLYRFLPCYKAKCSCENSCEK